MQPTSDQDAATERLFAIGSVIAILLIGLATALLTGPSEPPATDVAETETEEETEIVAETEEEDTNPRNPPANSESTGAERDPITESGGPPLTDPQDEIE